MKNKAVLLVRSMLSMILISISMICAFILIYLIYLKDSMDEYVFFLLIMIMTVILISLLIEYIFFRTDIFSDLKKEEKKFIWKAFSYYYGTASMIIISIFSSIYLLIGRKYAGGVFFIFLTIIFLIYFPQTWKNLKKVKANYENNENS